MKKLIAVCPAFALFCVTDFAHAWPTTSQPVGFPQATNAVVVSGGEAGPSMFPFAREKPGVSVDDERMAALRLQMQSDLLAAKQELTNAAARFGYLGTTIASPRVEELSRKVEDLEKLGITADLWRNLDDLNSTPSYAAALARTASRMPVNDEGGLKGSLWQTTLESIIQNARRNYDEYYPKAYADQMFKTYIAVLADGIASATHSDKSGIQASIAAIVQSEEESDSWIPLSVRSFFQHLLR